MYHNGGVYPLSVLVDAFLHRFSALDCDMFYSPAVGRISGDNTVHELQTHGSESEAEDLPAMAMGGIEVIALQETTEPVLPACSMLNYIRRSTTRLSVLASYILYSVIIIDDQRGYIRLFACADCKPNPGVCRTETRKYPRASISGSLGMACMHACVRAWRHGGKVYIF